MCKSHLLYRTSYRMCSHEASTFKNKESSNFFEKSVNFKQNAWYHISGRVGYMWLLSVYVTKTRMVACWFPVLVFIIYVNCLQDFRRQSSVSLYTYWHVSHGPVYSMFQLLLHNVQHTKHQLLRIILHSVLYIIIDCIIADDDPTGTESCRAFNF